MRGLITKAITTVVLVSTAVVGPSSPTAAAVPVTDQVAQPQTTAATKLMIVGDSISQGSSGDFTWRYRLAKHFEAAGTPVDFVGPRDDLFDNVANKQGDHSYGDPRFDADHNAIWGRPIFQAKDTIQAEVT